MSTSSISTSLPDSNGRFGRFGGRFVPETLMPALEQLDQAYLVALEDQQFQDQLTHLLRTYVGRPTALYFASNLTRHCGGAKIYLKREDLAHTGAHKINNAVGQAILAKHMGKHRIVAEDGCRTAWRGRPPRSAPSLVSNASCTWAPRTSGGNR